MDRVTIAALVLIKLIIITWAYLFGWRPFWEGKREPRAFGLALGFGWHTGRLTVEVMFGPWWGSFGVRDIWK